ncbi:MAG: diaminopimelate decarboxylase [Planctomycetes bacterium]|nr:diaminopimelate decarboxylase [Planctomycetota bacterium]
MNAPAELLARYGSPLYVYDAAVLDAALAAARTAFAGCSARYALKANANAVLLRRIAATGFGADAVSPLEVRAALAAGFAREAVSYTGHASSREELAAVSHAGVEITLDSIEGLRRLADVAPGSACGLRINTGIGAGHHRNVVTGGAASKFGVPLEDLAAAMTEAQRCGLRIIGLHQHVGSGILTAQPLIDAAEMLLRAATPWAQRLKWLDFGGGFGIPYRSEEAALDLGAVVSGIRERAAIWCKGNETSLELRFQPGRILVGACGTLLVRVIEVKSSLSALWVATDSGSHHLLRPMLYGAYHRIENLSHPDAAPTLVNVTGVLCESGDVLAHERSLPLPREGDILAIRDVGAYGFAMASTYNLRPRPAEVLLHAVGAELIRPRETDSSVLG